MHPGITWNGAGIVTVSERSYRTLTVQRQDGRCQMVWNVPSRGVIFLRASSQHVYRTTLASNTFQSSKRWLRFQSLRRIDPLRNSIDFPPAALGLSILASLVPRT